MQCPRCQHENPPRAQVCVECRADLRAELGRRGHIAPPGEAWEQVADLRQAAANALARSAHREAVVLLEQALAALKNLPEIRATIEQAIDLRLDVRNALWPLGELERILDCLREAETLAAGLDDQRRLGQIFDYMSSNVWLVGDHERAIELGRRALAIAETLRDLPLQFDANLRLSFVYHSLGDYRRAIAATRRDVDALEADLLRERFGQPTLLSVLSRAWLVLSLVELGEFADGIAEEGIQIAEEIVHPLSLVFAFSGVGVLYLRQGEFHKAISALERALKLSQVGNVPLWFPVIASSLGSAYARFGLVSEAVDLLERGVGAIAAMRLVANKSSFVAELSETYLLAGRLRDAGPPAREALELARAHRERGHEASALRLGEIAAHHDRPDVLDAEEHFRQAIVLAGQLGMRPLVAHCHLGLGELYRRAGKGQQAEEHLTTAVTMFREMDMRFWLEKAEAAMPPWPQARGED